MIDKLKRNQAIQPPKILEVSKPFKCGEQTCVKVSTDKGDFTQIVGNPLKKDKPDYRL